MDSESQQQLTFAPSKDAVPRLPWWWRRRVIIGLVVVALVALGNVAGYVVYSSFLTTERQAAVRLSPVRIGLLADFSGGNSNAGYGILKGVELARKELAANNIEIVKTDSRCDPDVGISALKTLIAQQVTAVIAEGCSLVIQKILPVAYENKLVVVSPAASSAALSLPDDYFFRMVPSDNLQAGFLAKAVQEAGIRKVAISHTDEIYGLGIAQAFSQQFTTLGGQVVVVVSNKPAATDLASQAEAIKAAQPQAVLVAHNTPLSAAAAIREFHQSGLQLPYFGSDSLYAKTIPNSAQQAAEGLLMTTFPTGTLAFKQVLYNEYQSADLVYAAPQAYDAFKALYLALVQTQKNGKALAQVLPSIEFKGVSGQVKFDQNGDLEAPNYKYDTIVVRGGQLIPINQQGF